MTGLPLDSHAPPLALVDKATSATPRLLEEPDALVWQHLFDLRDDQERLRDRLSLWPRETFTSDGCGGFTARTRRNSTRPRGSSRSIARSAGCTNSAAA
jgi:hypothetical protein